MGLFRGHRLVPYPLCPLLSLLPSLPVSLAPAPTEQSLQVLVPAGPLGLLAVVEPGGH